MNSKIVYDEFDKIFAAKFNIRLVVQDSVRDIILEKSECVPNVLYAIYNEANEYRKRGESLIVTKEFVCNLLNMTKNGVNAIGFGTD